MSMRRVAPVALLSALSAPTTLAMAQETPTVSVVLDGGNVAENIAAIFEQARQAGVDLRARSVQIQQGQSVCDVVNQVFPQPCGPFLSLVARLSGTTPDKLGAIGAGSTISLPGADVLRTRRNRYIVLQDGTQEQWQKTIRNWSALNAKRVLPDRSDDEITVSYDLYTLNLPIKDTEAAIAFGAKLRTSSIPNISVDVNSSSKPPVSLYSLHDARASQSEIEQNCGAGQLWSPDVEYSELSEADPDAQSLDSYHSAMKIPLRQGKPTIYLMDTELRSAANLSPAFDTAPPKQSSCSFKTFSRDEHANHVASIIASQPKSGYLGVWPNVQLEPRNIVKPPEGSGGSLSYAASILHDIGQTSTKLFPIVLFASGIPDWQQLSGPASTDTKPPLYGEISSSPALIVAAAGQAEPPDEAGRRDENTVSYPLECILRRPAISPMSWW